MKALHDVVQNGHVRYLGSSAMKATEFAQLQFIADKNGWTKFISMQNYYNLVYREEEREMIPFCQDNEFGKVAIIPYSPIARGILARPVGSLSTNRMEADRRISQLGLKTPSAADTEIVNRIEKIAKDRNVSMAAVATSWVVSKGALPIVGLNSMERVDDILKVLDFQLSEDEVQLLEEPYIAKPVQQ